MGFIFETPRLYVRRYTLADEEDFFRLNNDVDIVRYIRPPKSRQESHEFLLQNLALYDEFPFMGRWAMLEKESNAFVGSFAVFPIEHSKDIQLGYSLFKEYWGKGFATESIPAGRQYAFDHLCLKEIYAITEVANTASQKALMKCGFVQSGQVVEGSKTLFRFSSANPDYVETERLWIFPLSPALLEVYLQGQDKLENVLGLAGISRRVAYGLRELIERTTLPMIKSVSHDERLFHTFWLVVEKERNRIVAELGFKGRPDAGGIVEIGYGTMPSEEGKGIMTEAVGGMVTWAAQRKDVTGILAETNKENIASIRILEKNNFSQFDRKGDMLWWKKTVSNAGYKSET